MSPVIIAVISHTINGDNNIGAYNHWDIMGVSYP